jgi:hypothetical protein
MMTPLNTVPKVSNQPGFFAVILRFFLIAVEVLSYLIVIFFICIAYIVSPRGAHETLLSLGEGRRFDFYMSLVYAGVALGAGISCRWLRQRINRGS